MKPTNGAVAAQPRVARHYLDPDFRWCIDHKKWLWVKAGVILAPEEIEEIMRQANEIRPGKPN